MTEVRAFITKLETLAHRDSLAHNSAPPAGGEGAVDNQVRQFFDSLPPLLATISTFGSLLAAGRPVDETAFLAATAEIRSKAETLEFVRISDIAEHTARERDFAAFRRLELRLYEEFSRVAQAIPSGLQGSKFVPAAVMQNWCADHAFDTLIELGQALDEIRKHGGSASHCDGVIELLRLIYHACRHYGMETAAHLSMSLIDLFARARDDETPPDPMLLRIARSFSADLELLVDTVGSGGTPDMALIERLFEEAATVAFSASGTLSSTVIESRLGLPKSFRKVLTPESLKAAVAAMNQGQRFYIVRAALNNDEQAAAKFLEWISTGAASVISNVTVFDGVGTLFDFLLATSLSESQLSEIVGHARPDWRRAQARDGAEQRPAFPDPRARLGAMPKRGERSRGTRRHQPGPRCTRHAGRHRRDRYRAGHDLPDAGRYRFRGCSTDCRGRGGKSRRGLEQGPDCRSDRPGRFC